MADGMVHLRYPTTNSFSNNGRTVLVEERERAVCCLKQAMANMKMLFNINEASSMYGALHERKPINFFDDDAIEATQSAAHGSPKAPVRMGKIEWGDTCDKFMSSGLGTKKRNLEKVGGSCRRGLLSTRMRFNLKHFTNLGSILSS